MVWTAAKQIRAELEEKAKAYRKNLAKAKEGKADE
jgi:hypothetical protein